MDYSLVRSQVPGNWNCCIHELFEAQTAQQAGRLAVIDGNQSMSYHELNLRAEQLADALVALGVGPETIVAFYMDRSLDMLVGILGILKAGGAYIPLDPSYPPDRLGYFLADSQAPFLVSSSRLAANLPPFGGQVVFLDRVSHSIHSSSRLAPAVQPRPDNLVYILYTSGSTGLPKGVQIQHRSVAALLQAFETAYPAGPRLNGISLCPFGFDVSVWEFFSVLCFGGTLHILQPETFASPQRLADYLVNHEITSVYIPPALLADTFSALEKSAKPAVLERLLVGVEPIKQETLQRYRELLPKMQIINGYGPTETTICAAVYTFDLADSPNQRIPIGKPLAGYEIYLVDHIGQPIPEGEAGEVLIGGVGLARGYLNQPGLTAEKFAPHPFGAMSGERLYRTGDLARLLPDGNLEFIGRIDHQVKIRGFRVEPGEIEAGLCSHSEISEAIVVAHVTEHNTNRLVAYYKTLSGRALTASSLRDFLKGLFPDYMIPSAFKHIEAFHLTRNGKIDRRLLPNPDHLRPELVNDYSPPQTELEKNLAGTWQRVLGLEDIGVQDNFFELGGNSLLVARVLSLLQAEFEIYCSFADLSEAPTIGQLANRIEQNQAGVFTLPPRPIQRQVEVGPAPLSFHQQRIWLMTRLAPESPVYNIPAVFSIRGKLQFRPLQLSLDEIVRRHEALRTNIIGPQGQLRQVVMDARSVSLKVVDLNSENEQETEEQVSQILFEEARRPFDLQNDLLVRAVLVRQSPQYAKLLLTIHHIASDAWSFGIILKELGILYTSFLAGTPAALPKLTIQYRDFSLWQQEIISGPSAQEHLTYWKSLLQGNLNQLALPADKPRQSVNRYLGKKLIRPIPTALLKKIETFSRTEHATPFMTTAAAFEALMFRYTGQTDFVIGTVVANRSNPNLENLVGFFANTIPLQVTLYGGLQFKEVLRRTRRITLDALSHADLPLEKILEGLHLDRQPGINPIFQVVFAAHDFPFPSVQQEDLTIQFEEELDIQTVDFDLVFTQETHRQQPVISAQYNTDLFESSTVQRMLDHYQILLEAAVSKPETPISQLPLLSAEEMQTLFERGHSPSLPSFTSGFISVLEMIGEQVRRNAEAIAVEHKSRTLTYQQLHRRTNRLANYLRQLGLGPESVVGICLGRSPEMIVGLLGILKAGAAYVPLDPAYPPDRLASIMADAHRKQSGMPPVVLTQKTLVPLLAPLGWNLVIMDETNSGSFLTDQTVSEEDLTVYVSPQNLAYIIYTSGSTGTPKGVAISHYSLANYILAACSHFNLCKSDRSLQLTSFSFDAAAEEIFGCLASGASLVLSGNEMISTISGFLQACLELKLTVLTLPTAFWHLLGGEISSSRHLWPPDIRLVVIGGEKALPNRLEMWRRVVSASVRLVNAYGPTETTISSTWCELNSVTNMAAAVPIGQPVPGTQLYVVDSNGQPVPTGVVGELLIGGAGLARGYLNQPALTAEKFIPDFLGPDPGQRLYRTGDLVRWLDNVNLEFVGRVDSQVKVRGFRIELSEIEVVLSQHPGVAACAVAIHPDPLGENRLAAYISPKQTPQQQASLRTFLQEKLPAYMQPAAWIFLDNIPLTPGGKIDRRSLPEPDFNEISPIDELPHNPVEEVVAGLMAEIVGLKNIGVNTSFFDLGGHSLLATQFLSRLNTIFRVAIPLQTIFEKKTAAALARAVMSKEAKAGQAEQIARVYLKIGEMSPDEIKALLASKNR